MGLELFVVLFSSLLSGLIGVGISNFYHNRAEKRRYKLMLLEKLLGNRNDIKGEPFSEALNSVFIVFHDSECVISTLKAFHENALSHERAKEISNQRLLDLFKAMCKDLNIDPKPLTDDYFLQPFNIR